MQKSELLKILSSIIHPEKKADIVSLGMVEDIDITEEKLRFTLNFEKARDPFITSIKRAATEAVVASFPQYADKISVMIKEAAPKKVEKLEKKSDTGAIKNIIAISSGKGGVGKSTVTANLAVALRDKGFKVGVIDADIYGPSMPKMFGVEGYQPIGEVGEDGRELIIPAESYGIKIMSIGFFIKPDDALVWRGAMATNALKQLIHQTHWGEIDYLLIDLPPGTGDIHLTIVQELKVTGAIIVSTPQAVALADVVRGIKMFRSEGINIPILGLIENMAWFTPAELPDNKYFIFGKGGCRDLADREGLPFLGEIPLVQSIRENSDSGKIIVDQAFSAIADSLIKVISQK